MTENKRFSISQGYTDRCCYDWQNNQLFNFRETVELLNELNDENEQLKSSDDITELETMIMKLKEENKELNEQLSVMKSKGLKVLEFYEYKLKNADNKKEFDNAREELWIVKQVLCEMGVIK